jgi:multiple sugar transport system substrate-binding protein
VTIDWPLAANGDPLVIDAYVFRAVVFKDGGHVATAKEFVRFLAEEGWLAHWLTFSGDQLMPPMRKLLDQPFWLDPTDPHRMRAAIQLMTQPHLLDLEVWDQAWRSGPIWGDNVWGNAVHRVTAEGWSPEQAVDEAIARIKQILSE